VSNADRSPGTLGRLPRVGLAAALVAALGLCLMPGIAGAQKKPAKKPDRVRILSQNLYIGFDLQDFLEPALAGDVAALPDAAGAAVRDAETNDFRVRAQTIAQQIKKNKVDLAGLQEVALYRLEIPTDGGAPNLLVPNATYALVPLIDFIDTLLGALNKKARSKQQCNRFEEKHPGKECYQGYKLVGLGVNTVLDAENAADLDGNDATGVNIPPDDPVLFGIDADARLTVRDALIVRKGAGIKLANTKGQSFSPSNTIAFELLGGIQTIGLERGWVATDANVRGMKFHFVNTHLESESTATFREDQAAELVGAGGPASQPNTVLVGDLNSDPSIPPGSDPNADSSSNIAFNRSAAAGFSPVSGPGLTSGHAEILNNPNDNTFTKRLDWILTNNPSIRMSSSRVLNRFANGLWASDHGGVLSVLRVPGGKKK
jgi:endonuclease/exonuclease/phosphatase family metal-dependent hydrolase